jgi:hypothetical protein
MSEQITVSWVKCALDTEPRECTANRVIEAIRTGGKDGRLCQQVTQIRNRFECELALFPGDKKRAKEAIGGLKKKLPGVLWSGTFTRRANDALLQHSGLLCADLDSLNGELANVREKLSTSPHLLTLLKSPGGEGLKAVFKVPADVTKHPGSFRAVEKHVKELTGVQID